MMYEKMLDKRIELVKAKIELIEIADGESDDKIRDM